MTEIDPKQNVKTANRAGKKGWPSPRRASSHNYSDAEQRAWEAGMEHRCRQQYAELE